MIIVDTLLANLDKENTPIRVGIIGAGTMAKGIALQIVKYSKGIRLVAISNKTPEKAENVLKEIGVEKISKVTSVSELESECKLGKVSFTDNPLLLTQGECIDVIVEATGTIDYAAKVVLSAIDNKKHVVLMNAELDATLGPILKVYADRSGVIITNSDGDQPGVIMNLYRYVKGLGLRPVLCGNIKGLHDPYRNPTTQEGFAKKWNQNVRMVTSFADGTKISFEQAVVANATGMRVAKRGMHGFNISENEHVSKVIDLYDEKELLQGNGIVDYVIGASPASGVFVLGYQDDQSQQALLDYYKMGKGPLYCFYTPYHLCHLEVPSTIARAAILHDAVVTPIAGPFVEVVSIAKKDLVKGEKLDGIGGYSLYGVCENSKIARRENLLPMGLAENAVLNKDISKDEVVTFADVAFPNENLALKLWREQQNIFNE
ncbi:NAD(P)-binding domain-containing protein [Candidatus Woesebacteria bacterium]|nr:MAG: NAD(P)-binding domain-containing protein [Candidatus Woesebacteria bacterium]